MMDEKEYRQIVDQTFKKLERSFDSVDPDLAEYTYSQGAVTILFKDSSRLILSTQPSVRQIWLANASCGVAHHFIYDLVSKSWRDDKGKGIELMSYVKTTVQEASGVEIDRV